MRERKFVKFRIDMYEDTKSKIIDMKPERDLIHYVWNRFVVLAGKVNLEGNLYMSKNIPYTVETLAIEFNRGTYQVKLALDVLMELEMIELTRNNVYRVKNFAKHQNIKVKEESKSNNKEENIKNNEVLVKENSLNEVAVDSEKVSIDVATDEEEMVENKTSEDKIPILLETKKKKKSNKRKKKEENIETIDEDIEDGINDCFHNGDEDGESVEDDTISGFHDGDEEGRPLGEGECVVNVWSFGAV